MLFKEKKFINQKHHSFIMISYQPLIRKIKPLMSFLERESKEVYIKVKMVKLLMQM